jgi:hypothetical protein
MDPSHRGKPGGASTELNQITDFKSPLLSAFSPTLALHGVNLACTSGNPAERYGISCIS